MMIPISSLAVAATQPEEVRAVASVFALLGVVFLVVFAVSVAISVVVCLLLHVALDGIPREHRRMEPAMVWLLLVPCFGLVWNFEVFRKVPDSFRGWFESEGRGAEAGDCGRGLGLAYSIAAVFCVVPLANYLAAPVTLVLLIVCLVRFQDLRNRMGRPGPV